MNQKPVDKIKTPGGISFWGMSLLFVAALGFALFNNNGYFQYQQQRQIKMDSQETLYQLLQRNKTLSTEIKRLKNDPRYIEDCARRQFGMVRSDELVYIFSEKK